MNRLPDRFWDKVQMEPNSGCWLWVGGLTANGYSAFSMNNRQVSAHRLTYSAFKAGIPDGYHIDHICRVKCCVNPNHLEAVTPQENTLRGEGPAAKNARKTHCPKGHPYSKENTYIYYSGSKRRACKTCVNEKCRKYRLRKLAESK